MEKLSIIVPIYDVEECLSRCIESILAQTYTEFELILVNDGSPDKCAQIMEKYAKLDKRIINVYQDNQGVSAARNTGIKMATGKYVGFIDADDYIDKEFYYNLIMELESTGADIACCNWDYIYGTGEKIIHEVNCLPRIMQQKVFVEQLFAMPRTIGGSIWNKLFLKDRINTYFDETVAVCEDNLFLMQYCFNISKACYINKAMYHVFDFKGSTMRKNPGKIVYGLDVRKKMIELASYIDKRTKAMAEGDYLDICYLYCNRFKLDEEKMYYSVVRKHFIDYIKSNFIRILANKNIYWKTKLMYFVKFFCE